MDGQDNVPPPAAGGEGRSRTLCCVKVSSDDPLSWVFRDRFHLVAFMRALERLQVFVEISDLS